MESRCLVYDITIQVTKYTTGIKLMFQIVHLQEKSKSIKGHGLIQSRKRKIITQLEKTIIVGLFSFEGNYGEFYKK